MLEVATFWAPRPEHEKWRGDYLALLELQKRTVRRRGHRHVVVSDVEIPGFDVMRVDLPQPLMKAITSAQLAYLKAWSGKHRVVLLDVDCIICNDLNTAFDGSWDIGLTVRDHDTQPVQNGVMYFESGAQPSAVEMLERTLAGCEDWWGADQAALAQAIGPVPPSVALPLIEKRLGVRVGFLSTERHNFTAKTVPHKVKDRLVMHFKGNRKQYAQQAVNVFRLG